MNDLIIIGAGALAREVYHWSHAHPSNGVSFITKGFIDDNLEALQGYRNYPAILSTIEGYEPSASDVFICAIGNPEARARCVEAILKKGGRFTNLVHPSVCFGGNIRLGDGVIIGPFVAISADVVVDNFSIIDSGSIISHDVKIGEFCHIATRCALTGFVKLSPMVFVGAGSTILPSLSVAEGVLIGAGSVVTKSVKEKGRVVAGNPAKKLKEKGL